MSFSAFGVRLCIDTPVDRPYYYRLRDFVLAFRNTRNIVNGLYNMTAGHA